MDILFHMIFRRSHGRQILKGSSAGDHDAKTFFSDLLIPHLKTQQRMIKLKEKYGGYMSSSVAQN